MKRTDGRLGINDAGETGRSIPPFLTTTVMGIFESSMHGPVWQCTQHYAAVVAAAAVSAPLSTSMAVAECAPSAAVVALRSWSLRCCWRRFIRSQIIDHHFIWQRLRCIVKILSEEPAPRSTTCRIHCAWIIREDVGKGIPDWHSLSWRMSKAAPTNAV